MLLYLLIQQTIDLKCLQWEVKTLNIIGHHWSPPVDVLIDSNSIGDAPLRVHLSNYLYAKRKYTTKMNFLLLIIHPCLWKNDLLMFSPPCRILQNKRTIFWSFHMNEKYKCRFITHMQNEIGYMWMCTITYAEKYIVLVGGICINSLVQKKDLPYTLVDCYDCTYW